MIATNCCCSHSCTLYVQKKHFDCAVCRHETAYEAWYGRTVDALYAYGGSANQISLRTVISMRLSHCLVKRLK
jgi:hypothetical protein